jgi:norsolorinic acid ketoreductase
LIGIGKELAKQHLAKPKTTVIVTVRSPKDVSALQNSEFAVADGSKLIVVTYDSSQPETAKSFVSELERKHDISSIDTVIGNAGIGSGWVSVAESNVAEAIQHLNINAAGPLGSYLAVRPLLLKASEPRFVVISSELGSIGMQAERKIPDCVYGMSKAAVNFLVNKIHNEEEKLIAFPIHPG